MQVLQEDAAYLADGGFGDQFTVREIVLDAAEYPRCALRGAADHHRVGARVIEHLLGHVRRGDVAVRDDGKLDARLDRGEGVENGLAAITAGARAAVHGERMYAALFGYARDLDAVAVIWVPARAYLERHRNIDRLHHRFEYARYQRLVLQERGARHHVAHLFRWAAHVDDDELRAVIGVVARGLGHRRGNDANEQHRARLHLADVIDALLRFHAVPQE